MWPWLGFNIAIPLFLPVAISWLALGRRRSVALIFAEGWLYLFVFLQLSALAYDALDRNLAQQQMWGVAFTVVFFGALAIVLYAFAQKARLERGTGRGRALASLVVTAVALIFVVIVRNGLALW